MGNLAVRLYEDLPAEENPKEIPGNWPAQTEDLGEGNEAPDDGNTWLVMSQEEFDLYVQENQAEYDAWKEAQAAIESTDKVLSSISELKQFLRNVLAETVANQPALKIRFETSEISVATDSGCGHLALKKCVTAVQDETLTSEILLTFGNKVREYLGLSAAGSVDGLAEGF